MIAFVRGRVAEVAVDHVVVDLGGDSGGVGLAVQCPPALANQSRVGDNIQLATSLVVREDGWTLYGFVDADQRSVFELLQTVTGVGPRLALAVLATLTPDDLRRAVQQEDLVTLTRVPGVGRKGAQRLVLDLKDRLGAPSGGAGMPVASAATAPATWRVSVVAALVSLGWSTKEAESAAESVTAQAADMEAEEGADVAALLKAALQSLSRPADRG
jgi:Holliday junction DNA helicase RuvA